MRGQATAGRGMPRATPPLTGSPLMSTPRSAIDADMLVLGAGKESPVAHVDPLIVDRPVGPVIRSCLSRARCPVVIISPATAAQLDIGDPGQGARTPAAARG